MDKWISVNDRLPEEFESVLIYDPGQGPFQTINEGYRVNNSWGYIRSGCYPNNVTHWMPLPEAPVA